MAKKQNTTEIKVNNQTYWQDRAVDTFLAGEKDSLKVARHLKSLYQESIKEIDKKIYEFYGKYATERGITLDEAKQILNKGELKDFKGYIKEMLEMGDRNNFSPSEMYEFKRLYNKARITRLEELQANIRGELDKLAVKTIDNIDDLLLKTYEDGYYRTIYYNQRGTGVFGTFSGLNTRAIEKAVSQKYSASNYSINSAGEGVWNSTNKLMQILTNEIPRGIVLGYNPRKLAREIVSPKVDKTLYNNTLRLIRTEYSHILNQSILDGYKEAGIEQFKIVTALDSRRCDDCGEVEDKIINISEAQEGINMPPFHPNCRCTTKPYFEEDDLDKMSDEEVHAIFQDAYNKWKNNLVSLEDDKVVYKSSLNLPEDKYSKSTIETIANDANNLIQPYMPNKTKWTGKVIIDSSLRDEVRAGMDFNGDLRVQPEVSPYQIIHDLIHAHSSTYAGYDTWKANANIEDGTVDLLAQEIAKINNIPSITNSYDYYIDALLTINDSLKIGKNNLEFGQKLIAIPLKNRYSKLKHEVKTYIKKNNIDKDTIEYAQLDNALEILKGNTLIEDLKNNLIG